MFIVSVGTLQADLMSGHFPKSAEKPQWIGAMLYGFETDQGQSYEPLAWGGGILRHTHGSSGFTWFAYLKNNKLEMLMTKKISLHCAVPLLRVSAESDEEDAVVEHIVWRIMNTSAGAIVSAQDGYLEKRCERFGGVSACPKMFVVHQMLADIDMFSCMENESLVVTDWWLRGE